VRTYMRSFPWQGAAVSNTSLTGSCLCGRVHYDYTGEIKVFQYCHCSRCRKFTDSAHASNIIGDPEQFRWTCGGDFVGRYELPGARHFATCFYKKCGSSLPWITSSKKAIVIPAGTLDTDPLLRPVHNIYYATKPPGIHRRQNS
jgi:hypothetical protein